MQDEKRDKIANTTSSVLGSGLEEELDWRGDPIKKENPEKNENPNDNNN